MTRTGIITLAVLLFVVALGGFFFGRATIKPVIEGETTRVDTLYIRDTITREKPVYTRIFVRDSIPVIIHDTTIVKDTVWLPREVKIYEDERYRAEVSGYQPSLDRIDIFVAEKVITQDRTQVVTEKMRKHSLGVGIEANYETAFRMPVQIEYGYKMNRVLTAYGYVEYELFTRQCGVGIGISANIEF